MGAPGLGMTGANVLEFAGHRGEYGRRRVVEERSSLIISWHQLVFRWPGCHSLEPLPSFLPFRSAKPETVTLRAAAHCTLARCTLDPDRPLAEDDVLVPGRPAYLITRW